MRNTQLYFQKPSKAINTVMIIIIITILMAKIIDQIYHDPAGHGSTRTTYEDAKKKDQRITYGDIQAWFKKKH